MSMLMETPYEGYNDGDLQKSFEAAIWYRGERAAADPKSIETRLKVSQDELEKILGKILDRY